MQDQDLSGIVIQVVILSLAILALLLFAWDDRKSRRERAAEDRLKAEAKSGQRPVVPEVRAKSEKRS
ncbi:MAG: hypothetical protein GC138_01640 [Gammaproteobacteria bacterium]|nr:hypothetical protein [Gammaproteobacteria bacterium]